MSMFVPSLTILAQYICVNTTVQQDELQIYLVLSLLYRYSDCVKENGSGIYLPPGMLLLQSVDELPKVWMNYLSNVTLQQH